VLKAGACPRTVNEQNNISAFKRIFVEQAEFAAHKYF
jgi:hypothetical protein